MKKYFFNFKFNYFLITILSFFSFNKALAHVTYFVSTNERKNSFWDLDFNFLVKEFFSGKIFLSILCGLIGFIFLSYGVNELYFIKNIKKRIDVKLGEYDEFVPWMLRLALGVSFIGAGVKGYLLSPALLGVNFFSNLQILMGFSFLFGVFIIPMAFLGVVLFGVAMNYDVTILGSLEVFGALMTIILLDDGRPGVDDLLGIMPPKIAEKYNYLAENFLRWSLGGSFIFLALSEKLLHPLWALKVDSIFNFSKNLAMSPIYFIYMAGVVELILGIFIFLNIRIRWCLFIAFVTLVATFFLLKEDVVSHVTLFGVICALFIKNGNRLVAK